MPIIEKSTSGFKPFSWINHGNLPKSKGYKFELYVINRTKKLDVDQFIDAFYTLFRPFLKEIEIGNWSYDGSPSRWGAFCIQTWNPDNDTDDYSPKNKSRKTARYLRMLQKNNIAPEYTGLCHCLDWDAFLPIILDCIVTGQAPYSLFFYHPPKEFFFYFHHTYSFGVYYKHCNNAIKHILGTAMAEDLGLWGWNDKKTLASLGKVPKS